MNKKRVALALAAALGINTLMVTVGQVGQQTVIAHAVDGKLVNPDDISLLGSLKIRTLKTQVKELGNGQALLTFPELIGDIKNLVVKTQFTHKVFGERQGVDTALTSGITATWDNNADELKVVGMKTPGIYEGKVEVEFVDGSKETYTISLRKTPSDSISFTTNVTTGMVEVKDLKFSNGAEEKNNLFTASDITLTNKRTGMIATASNGTSGNDFKFNALDLAEKGKLQEGDVLELKVNYGAGVGSNKAYTLTSGIVLVKQATPKIEKAITTNSTGFSNTIVSQINTDFGVTDGKDTGSSLTAGGKVILDYEQTKNGDKFGGADFKTTISNLNVSLEMQGQPSTVTTQDNYVHGVTVSYSNNNGALKSTGLIGDYVLSINGQSTVYFDAMSGLVATSSGAGTSQNDSLHVTFKDDKSAESALPTQIAITNSTVSLDFNSIEHGYVSVGGIFTVDKSKDWSSIDSINDQISKDSTKSHIKASIDTAVTKEEDIKFSLILAVDRLDGVASQTKFERTSESEGKITLVGGQSLNGSTLTVQNASVGSGTVSGNDLVFDVQFNGDVPSNISWSLTPSGSSSTLTGVLDSGSVEAVNITEIKATNEGAEGLAKQFLVSASTDLTFPEDSDGKLTVDNLNSNRVTLEQFKEGPHTVNFVVNKGKYQGTYSAGINVETQEVGVILRSTDIATSNSITLGVRGVEFIDGALTDVKDAWLEYRLATDNVWVEERKDKIDLKKLASEQEFRVTKTGLRPSTLYDFRIAYELIDDPEVYYSNILEDEDTLAQGSNGSGTITGSGGTTSGTSTGSTTITVSTSNSTMSGNNIDVNLPSGFRYDSGKSPVVTGIKYKDKDGKIVTEVKDQFKNVTAKFNGTRVELVELVPSKDYTEITVDYTDNNGKVRSIILKNVKLTSTVESDKYLANIYEVVFGRPADESGYHYHLKNLKNKSVSLREFVLNMLSEKEFGEKYKTTESKIEALYSAIVNRTSDEAGKKFWVDEYKKVLAVYGSESNALRAIADRMVNEGELKTLAEKMNLKW